MIIFTCYELIISCIFPKHYKCINDKDKYNNNNTNNNMNITTKLNTEIASNHLKILNKCRKSFKKTKDIVIKQNKCDYCSRYISEFEPVYMFKDMTFCTATCRNNLIIRDTNYTNNNQSKSFSL